MILFVGVEKNARIVPVLLRAVTALMTPSVEEVKSARTVPALQKTVTV